MGVKFGKLPHEYDPRTVQIGSLIRQDIHAPTNFDFDKGRAEILLNDWGSRDYKNDVLAAQLNYVIRRGRLIEKRTLPLLREHAIGRYQTMTGVWTPGDSHDTGLSVLNSMKYWREKGWLADGKYKALAYGELDPLDTSLLRKAVFVFTGIFIGFWLPNSVENNFNVWEYWGATGEEWQPGRLGGTLAYCKAYNSAGFEILAWDKKIYVTNSFVTKYADEAWAVITDLSTLTLQVIDIEKLHMLRSRLLQKEEQMPGD
jgi:hypothetical protein